MFNINCMTSVNSLCLAKTRFGSDYSQICSPHGEHQSSGPRPVKLCSDQYFFQFFFSYIYIYIQKFESHQ